MPDDEKPRRENVLPLDELHGLTADVLGNLAPDRLVSWLGVSKRNAERWISGDSTYPPRVVGELQRLAPLVDELLGALDDLVEEFKQKGIPENLVRLRLREYSKDLSDEPPPKPGPRRD